MKYYCNMDEDKTNDLYDSLVSEMFSLWVVPELQKRSLSLSKDEIYKVLVEMPAGEENSVKVFLNSEATLIVTGKAARDLKAGEEVTSGDLSTLENVYPADIDPNSGWICYAKIAEGKAAFAFDARRNKADASALIGKARAFFEIAKEAKDKSIDVAWDNAYSAAELTVQAQMLTFGGASTKKHGVRAKWFYGWTNLENSPKSHYEVLCDLKNNREQSRYSPDPVKLKPNRIEEVFTLIEEMITNAENRIN